MGMLRFEKGKKGGLLTISTSVFVLACNGQVVSGKIFYAKTPRRQERQERQESETLYERGFSIAST